MSSIREYDTILQLTVADVTEDLQCVVEFVAYDDPLDRDKVDIDVVNVHEIIGPTKRERIIQHISDAQIEALEERIAAWYLEVRYE